MATFSDVASAWRSTITTGVRSRSSSHASVRATKRIVDRRHERAPHQVEHADGHAVDGERSGAAPRRRRRIVRRPNDPVAAFEVLGKIALVENMVAAGDEVDAGGEHLVGGLRGQAETARCVFAVSDAGVDVMLLAKQRDATLQRFATRGTDDVPDYQNVERAFYRRADAFAFFCDFRK